MARHGLIPGIVLTILLTGASAAGIAVAAESLLDSTSAAVLPSEPPGLLPPITAEGRVGWACEAERAARAMSARDAHLPALQ